MLEMKATSSRTSEHIFVNLNVPVFIHTSAKTAIKLHKVWVQVFVQLTSKPNIMSLILCRGRAMVFENFFKLQNYLSLRIFSFA